MTLSKTAWQSAAMPKFAKLSKSTKCDVVVIGGGVTGLSAAYFLTKAGKQVCLLERDRLGQGDTGCTTAHLTCVTDLRLGKLASRFGKDAARLVWLGGMAATDIIQSIVAEEKIDCQFKRVPGFLHARLDSAASPGDESKELKKEAELAAELGFPATFLENVPLIDRPGIAIANQATIHPLEYLAGLAQAVAHQGARFTNIPKPRSSKRSRPA